MRTLSKPNSLLLAFSTVIASCGIAFFLQGGYALASATLSRAFVGHWEGALSLRGSQLPVRIHGESPQDTLPTTLDIPNLVMASSGGEYGSSLRQLALDGIAAVRYLRS